MFITNITNGFVKDIQTKFIAGYQRLAFYAGYQLIHLSHLLLGMSLKKICLKNQIIVHIILKYLTLYTSSVTSLLYILLDVFGLKEVRKCKIAESAP